MVVQLSPDDCKNKAFASCFMHVDSVAPWGVQGFIRGIGPNRDEPGGVYRYHAEWSEFEVVGVAQWPRT